MDQYCAYLRKSRADRDAEMRGEGETLARHKKMLEDLSRRMNLLISRFYSEVVSGETIADRPVMRQLLRDVETGLWAGVFVIEVERLARGNTKDQGAVADAFKYTGTKILTLSKTYDPEDEFDEEYFEFGLFMSRREYKTINRRLQRGRIAAVKEGRFIGGTAPYGYRKVKAPDKGYTLEIVPEQAEVVKMIFDWYCHGLPEPDGSIASMGRIAIARRLDLLGIRPPQKPVWSKDTIGGILGNATYTGMVHFGREKEVKISAGGEVVKKRTLADEYIMAPGLHPAIIDQDMFAKVQRMKRANRKNTTPARSVLQNPFSGLIYCKKCGVLMTRLAPNSRNRYDTLKCPNRYCENVSAPMHEVEQQVLSFLRDLLRRYEIDTMIPASSPVTDQLAGIENSIEKIDTELRTLSDQMKKAYDFLEREVYTLDVFRDRQETLKRNISALEKNRADLAAELDRFRQLAAARDDYLPKLKDLLEKYDVRSARENNDILKGLIARMEYGKDQRNNFKRKEKFSFVLDIHPSVIYDI